MQAHTQSEDIELHQDLPKIAHASLEQMPADILQRSAAKAGFVYKQGRDFRAAFKKRWFVLWRHPAAKVGTSAHTYALLWYDTPESSEPNDFQLLQPVCSFRHQAVRVFG